MKVSSAAAVAPARIDYRTTLSSRQKWTIFFGIMIMLFLSALDGTIVATAQPAIVRQFTAIDLISWVTGGYLLSSTAMVPILGKLSDLYGRKVIMMTSTVIFLVGSAASGWAPNMHMLILARVVQGIGAAGITDISFAAIADLWAPGEQGQISGYVSAVFGLSSVVGPFLGGWLTDHLSWRAVFFVNVPIGIFALIFVALKMPRLASGAKAAVDWIGVALLLATVLPFLFGLTLDRAQYPWSSATMLSLMAGTAVALLLFLVWESRHPAPLMPLRLFRNRTFSVVVAASALFGAGFMGAIIYLAIYLVGVNGVSATKAGSTMVPMMLGMVIGAGLGAGMAQKLRRYKPFIIGGLAVACAALYLMATMTADTPLLGVMWRIAMLGLGCGPLLPLLGMAVMQTAPLDEMGLVTSVRSFFQSIGQMLAVSVFGVILSTTLTQQMATRMKPIQDAMPPQFASQFDMTQMKNEIGGSSDGATSDAATSITDGIKKAFAGERAIITHALRDQDATAIESVQKNPLWPAAIKQVVANRHLDGPTREAALTQALAALDQAEQGALTQGAAVGIKVSRAIKESFNAAITPLFMDGLYLAALCLLVLLFMPEVDLSASQPVSATAD